MKIESSNLKYSHKQSLRHHQNYESIFAPPKLRVNLSSIYSISSHSCVTCGKK